jgi:hypothetical protein
MFTPRRRAKNPCPVIAQDNVARTGPGGWTLGGFKMQGPVPPLVEPARSGQAAYGARVVAAAIGSEDDPRLSRLWSSSSHA